MVTDDTRNKILHASEVGKPLTIRTFSFLPKTQQYIDSLLKIFLDDLGIPYVLDQVSYCVKELAVNAKKANMKRVYFQEKGLRIENPDHYKHGMLHFKSETLNNQGHYINLLKDQELYIKIELLRWNDCCSVAVRNNVEILPTELERVQDKIDKAHRYNSLEDAFAEVLDETEGAGLGILVLILMLKNLGFEGDFFQIYTLSGETIARIILPLSTDL